MNKAAPQVPPADADDALALILANTRMAERPGAKRPHALTDVATAIRVAEKGFGSLKEVAGRVGISTEMLSRFLSVERLHPKVLAAVASRRIDSLNPVLYMAALPKADQPVVADAVIAGQLSGTDVRALAPLRKRLPSSDIMALIRRVASSRDQTAYVIEFPLTRPSDLPAVRRAFRRASDGGLVGVRSAGDHRGKAVLTRHGLQVLRAAARKERVPFRDFVRGILPGAHHEPA